MLFGVLWTQAWTGSLVACQLAFKLPSLCYLSSVGLGQPTPFLLLIASTSSLSCAQLEEAKSFPVTV